MIFVSPKLDSKFLTGIFSEVAKKLNFRQTSKLFIAFLDSNSGKWCEQIIKNFKIEDKKNFRNICKNLKSASSFTFEGKEFILLKIDGELLQNKKAIKGLLAHELMHTTIRLSGFENYLEEKSYTYLEKYIAVLAPKFGEKIAENFSVDLLKTAIFTLKDLIANHELIKKSFSEDIEEYYSILISGNVCPMPLFYRREATLEQLKAAIIFELQLLPMWLPLTLLKGARTKIHNRIRKCYEANIKELIHYTHRMHGLYPELEKDKGIFIKKFFEELLIELKDIIYNFRPTR
jgi:hypothetical protein